MSASPSERALQAKLAALTKWAHTDAVAGTEKARSAFLNRFELEVDPDGALSESERARRAACAKKAYFAKLALKSAQARRKKAA